jgi:hypothetical protein
MKLCILLVGQMRTYDNKYILDSYNHLSNYEDVDLYIYTWKNKGYSNRHGNPDFNEKQNDIITKNDIIKHYSKLKFLNIKEIIIDDFEIFYDSLTDEYKSIYNAPLIHQNMVYAKVNTSLPIEYKYQQAINCLYNQTYDNVIVLRPDMEILTNIPVSNPIEDVIYFKCVCDRCIDHCWFGTPHTIIKQLHNIFDNYIKNCKCVTSDNNELLIYQCVTNNIQIQNFNGHFVKQHFF